LCFICTISLYSLIACTINYFYCHFSGNASVKRVVGQLREIQLKVNVKIVPYSKVLAFGLEQSARGGLNSLECIRNYSVTSNNMKLVHWPLMGGLLHMDHMVQRGGDWAGPQPAQAPPRCTKCNSPPVNGQCTNHRIAE